MNTLAKRFLPLGTMVLALSFLLTGCDQVLDAFYPELNSAKYAVKTFELKLDISSSMENVVVALVPYDEANGFQVPADRSRWNIQSWTTGDQTPFAPKFSLDPQVKGYKLVAFNDADKDGKPNADFSEATVVLLGFSPDGKFTANDVVDNSTVNQVLSSFNTIDQATYNELFPSADGVAVWLTTPKDLSTASSLEDFTLSRNYDYRGLAPIDYVQALITGPAGPATVDIYIDPYYQWDTDIALVDYAYASTYDFSSEGSYTVTLYYSENGITKDGGSASFYVGASGGYEAWDPVQLKVTVSNWVNIDASDPSLGGASQGYVYYTDGYNYYQIGYVDAGDYSTVEYNVPYLPGGYLLMYVYDANYVYLGTTSGESDSTKNEIVSGVSVDDYDGYTPINLSWDLAPDPI